MIKTISIKPSPRCGKFWYLILASVYCGFTFPLSLGRGISWSQLLLVFDYAPKVLEKVIAVGGFERHESTTYLKRLRLRTSLGHNAFLRLLSKVLSAVIEGIPLSESARLDALVLWVGKGESVTCACHPTSPLVSRRL